MSLFVRSSLWDSLLFCVMSLFSAAASLNSWSSWLCRMQLPSSLFSESPFLSAQQFFLFFALCFQLVPGEYLSGNAKNSTSNLSHEKLNWFFVQNSPHLLESVLTYFFWPLLIGNVCVSFPVGCRRDLPKRSCVIVKTRISGRGGRKLSCPRGKTKSNPWSPCHHIELSLQKTQSCVVCVTDWVCQVWRWSSYAWKWKCRHE